MSTVMCIDCAVLCKVMNDICTLPHSVYVNRVCSFHKLGAHTMAEFWTSIFLLQVYDFYLADAISSKSW